LEDEENYEALHADFVVKNEEIKKRNERLNKIKTRVKFIVNEEETDFNEFEEKCLIKLLNYRDPPQTAEAHPEPEKAQMTSI
jgi:hypothetical protein